MRILRLAPMTLTAGKVGHGGLCPGNGRGYLCALITGDVTPAAAQGAIDAVNADLPHYRQIRKFTILASPFTAQDGLLTAMGKLRRDAIDRRFSAEIATMYSGKSA